MWLEGCERKEERHIATYSSNKDILFSVLSTATIVLRLETAIELLIFELHANKRD